MVVMRVASLVGTKVHDLASTLVVYWVVVRVAYWVVWKVVGLVAQLADVKADA